MSLRRAGEFPGEVARFAEVRAFAESFGAAAGLAHEAVQRLVLVLEELFTNTASHGYGSGPAGPVWIALEARSDSLEVLYEDAAPPFDPFAGEREGTAAERSAAGQPLGGLGIALVRGLSASARYAHRGGRNRITLLLASGPHPGTPGAPGGGR